ncbi:hypothetical protein CNMCM6106_008467 [Aspergillus hiratsukae]|uniref:Uncharacterized protein n=1 Tax=Aspergillus hiratsukae TaxID=1194566 RepID=A0A8H6QKC5_9EURO|nr:hypothetical protein CNMCM6106_008467 [Aspergillus hiratsukae]
MLPNWLLDPEGYTILTACGPHEKARELQFEPRNRRGVLSYFLLRTLTKLGSISTRQEQIYAHLCAQFHAKWPKQSPMLYGNKDLAFFGRLISPCNSVTLSVFRGDQRELFLRAGQAHGAYKDDVYALHPCNPTVAKDVDAKDSGILVKIIESRAVLSILKAIDGSDIPAKVETGWNAEAVTQINLEKVPIRLVASLRDRESWFRMGVDYPSVSLHMSEEAVLPFLFHLVQLDEGQYEIQNESCERIFGPIALSDDPGSCRRIFDALQHLTRFKHIEALENRHACRSFEDSFTIQIRDSTGKILDTSNCIEVNHGEELYMTLHNHSKSPVCVHLYDMGPTWKVQSLQKASYTVLVPTERPEESRKLKLKMIVPDELRQQGQRSCIDIIKVFVTSQPTSMWMLELNPLHDISKPHAASRGIHKLPRFLSSLSFEALRGGEAQTEENWSTRNLRVRTVIRDHT